MKKLIAIIAAAVSFTAFTNEAQAGYGCESRVFLGYDSCGNLVYRVRYIADYDCNGCPIYGYYREVVSRPRCDDFHYGGYHRGYDYGYHRGYHHGYRHRGTRFNGHRGSISIDFSRRKCR